MKKLYFFILVLILPVISSAQICVGTAGQLKWECWRNLFDDELGELYANENFPVRADVSQTVYKTQSPVNFDNLMGGMLRGFISVPVSDTVVFNVTGDDKVRFYLSDGTDPANKSLEAYMDNWSNIEEHDKYPEQTSDSIFLAAGTYYYFELIYVEGYGGDHVSLWWKTDNVDPLDWNLLSSAYISDVDCLPPVCPERGTPCDDGDSLTSDDIEDGFCNCFGTATTSNTCIGEKAEITTYSYDSIPGNSLNDLYSAQDYPAMPDRSKSLSIFGEPWANVVDSTGTLIQAYLTVPVTGNYKFNITGNNDCIFFLSSDEDPANKQAHQILVVGSTYPTEHDKYIFQSTSFISLDKGKYYYVELNHKEGSYSEHYSIFWQTPFTEPDQWKRIPDLYFFDYDCEIACIPQGYPCDDGDPFTNDDMYNDNCECEGTPCSGSDCDDPIASYVPYAKCHLTDQLDNRTDANWLSCTRDVNPNPLRDSSHWIQYDFGQEYIVHGTHVWNYNGTGQTQSGFENVAIDYSVDGTTWTELGIYNWTQAIADDEYSGFMGPDFGGVPVRYVLVTCLDDPAIEPCRGFGKMTFTTFICLNPGTPCDDGNPLTVNDTLNYLCICEGILSDTLDCTTDHLSLGDTLLPPGNYGALLTINSGNLISTNSTTSFTASQEIELLPGFDVPSSSIFQTIIGPCSNTLKDEESELKKFDIPKEPDYLKVMEIPDTDIQMLEFLIPEPGVASIEILDQSGNILFGIVNNKFENKGYYQKRFRTKKLNAGVYQLVYRSNDIKEVEKLLVI